MKNAPQDGPHKRNSKNIILYAIFSIWGHLEVHFYFKNVALVN
jgi:hypothetical protein